MTLAAIRRRAGRLPAIARDGLRYPTLRQQARPRSVAQALAALDFDRDDIARLEPEFEQAAAILYPRLAATARAAGAIEAATRATRPSASSREAKKLLYLAVRMLAPELVVETGPFNGAASAFLLAALEENGAGRLLSFDVADARDALGVPLPAGREPGWIIPLELRHRFELVLGDVRRTLQPWLARDRSIDLFVHDSLHTLGHMLFEYRTAWRHLRRGGMLVSDDVGWNPAFWLFTRSRLAPFEHVGSLGLTRKRL